MTVGRGHASILRSTFTVGGATLIAMAFGLLRTKAIALEIGPEGFGVFSLLLVLFTTGSAIAGFNIQSGGIRQIADTVDDPILFARTSTALWILTFVVSLTGAALLWTFETLVYVPQNGIVDHPLFPWVAIAVFLNTINATQTVFLQVAGRIGRIAIVRVASAALSAVIGAGAVVVFGQGGLYAAILAPPLCAVVVTLMFRSGLSNQFVRPGRWLFREWGEILSAGFAMTLAAIIAGAGQMAIRYILNDRYGLEGLGLYQSVHTLSSLNLNLILTAMAVDYLPRLSRVKNDVNALNAVVEEQLSVLLIIAKPLLPIACGLAGLTLYIFYSSEFTGAYHALQWQIAGDSVKLFVWAIGFLLIAKRARIVYVLTQIVFDALNLALLAVFSRTIGIEAASISYVFATVACGAFSYAMATGIGCVVSRRVLLDIALLLLVLAVICLAGYVSPLLSLALSILAGGAYAIETIRRLGGIRNLGLLLRRG